MWKITLSDGTVIDGLGMHAGSFVSETEVTAATFAGKLSKVKIEGPADAEEAWLRGEHGPMELAAIDHFDGNQPWPGGWHFTLSEISPEEMERRSVRSDLEYIAMMAGVDL